MIRFSTKHPRPQFGTTQTLWGREWYVTSERQSRDTDGSWRFDFTAERIVSCTDGHKHIRSNMGPCEIGAPS